MIEAILKKYLEAINAKQADDIDKGKTLEVKVHQGYYQTIKRYIENSSRITLVELHRILRLYSIDDIPAIEDIADKFITIFVVPQPSIILQDVVVPMNITSVPQPSVEVIIMTVSINSVPQPSVTLSIPTTINSVPQPSITVIIVSEALTYVPQPSIQLLGVLEAVPTITNVPQPTVLTVEDLEIVIMSIPQPVMNIITPVSTGNYYYGFTPYANKGTRDMSVSYMQTLNIVTTMLSTNNYDDVGFLQEKRIEDDSNKLPCTNWHMNIPVGESSYMVFLIPETLIPRTSWQSDLGNGPIGGTLNESIAGNHWPEPDAIVQHDGEDYYLYVGNRRRRLSGTITLNS